MKIVLNGEPAEISAKTLAQALVELGFGDAKVATAINGKFIATAQRQTTHLEAGDHIEVLAPMQGG